MLNTLGLSVNQFRTMLLKVHLNICHADEVLVKNIFSHGNILEPVLLISVIFSPSFFFLFDRTGVSHTMNSCMLFW